MSVAYTERAVFAALRVVLAATSGLDLSQIVRRSALVASSSPYVAVRRVTNAASGRTFEGEPGVYTQHRLLSVQIDAVGDDAIDALMASHSLLLSVSPVKESLTTAGVGVLQVGPMVDRARSTQQAPEMAAGFEIVLSYVQRIQSVETAATQEITTQIQTEDLGPITTTHTPGGGAASSMQPPEAVPLLPYVGGLFPL